MYSVMVMRCAGEREGGSHILYTATVLDLYGKYVHGNGMHSIKVFLLSWQGRHLPSKTCLRHRYWGDYSTIFRNSLHRELFCAVTEYPLSTSIYVFLHGTWHELISAYVFSIWRYCVC